MHGVINRWRLLLSARMQTYRTSSDVAPFLLHYGPVQWVHLPHLSGCVCYDSDEPSPTSQAL